MADPQVAKPSETESALRSPSGADLVLLLLLIMVGFGVWAVTQRVVTEALHDRKPSEQRINDVRGVTKQKAALTTLQTETTEFEKSLTAARLDQINQQSAVASYTANYPGVAGDTPPSTIPRETVNAYRETTRAELLANSLVASLEKQLTDLRAKVEQANSDLTASTEQANSELRRANLRHALLKKSVTLFLTFAIVTGLVWLVRLALWKLARNKRMSTAEGFRPFVLALGALLMLFAYDQFGFAGAALIGMLLLLFVLRRINWPKPGVLAK